MQCGHTMPFGTRLHERGVTFRLFAPGAKKAALLVRGVAAAQAAKFEAGWWTCELEGATAGTAYQWRIDDEVTVPDPASRSNPQGPQGPSVVVDPCAYRWKQEWQGRPWTETVLYELHVGTFTHEGTFVAAAGRLPELAALGITAIELMPVSTFGGRFGWGYDGVLHFAPHPAYGTPDDLKALIDEAHRLGLMVFLDVVYNHFGPEGNYLPRYAPGFFSQTHESPWGAAINFDGEGCWTVRDFFVHNALYWIQEFQFDGLRLDAVHAIVDNGERHLLQELSETVRAATRGRHVHLVLENERNQDRWLAPQALPGRYDAQWNDDFHHAVHVAFTGETQGYYHDYGAAPLDLLGRSLTHGMLFEPSERTPGGARHTVQAAPPQVLTTLVNFAHNHDQVGNRARGERLSELVAPPARMLPTLLALLTPAIPMLFFGEEVGATEPFLYFADWEGHLREAVREGRKREFGHVGGSELPDPCSATTFDASRPDPSRAKSADGAQWLAQVREALAARARWITPRQSLLAHGTHTWRRVGGHGLAVQWRYTDGQMLNLELNMGNEPLAVSSAHAGPAAARHVFAHNRDNAAEGEWPAWSARWTLGAEITL